MSCFCRLTLESDGNCDHITCETARELIAQLAIERGRPMRKERVVGIL
jgi:hypothetical protein